MSYKLNVLDEESIALTENHWRALIGDDDLFTIEYAELFNWCRQHINYTDNELVSYAYGIFKKATENKIAHAIVEIIQRPHGKKMTKLLKLDVSPSLADDTDLTTLNELVAVMLAAILGTIEISGKNASNEIKIYGRTRPMLSVLRELHKIFDTDEDLKKDIKTKISGRWLEISLRK